MEGLCGPPVARIEMRPSRTAGVGLLLFLLGVVTGRLILEPSGTGFTVFLVSLPFVLLVLIALFGVGTGILLEAVFAGTALVVRSVVLYAATGWIVLILIPAAAVTLYVLINTIRAMAADRAGMRREGKEEE